MTNTQASANELEQALEDLCFANGLNISEVKALTPKVVEHVKYLEMFFLGFPNAIMHMEKFPNLTRLKIIAQELSTISGLDTCVNLKELWICECKLNSINTGLKNCHNLKMLYLYSNKIEKIQNLSHLNLEKLWLNDNKIKNIENINHMTSLKDLNLAKNQIETIGESLSNLHNLETLNLASNQIENLNEIISLQSLPHLKNFSLKDPQYGYNPVTLLCNYSLFVIYHLPGLNTLDNLQVSQKVFKELADSTINKKKLWYFMKLNTLNRQINEITEKLDYVKQKQSLPITEQINKYVCKVRDIKKLISISKDLDANGNVSDIKQKEELIRYLEDKINENRTKLKIIDNQYNQSLNNLSQNFETLKNYNYIELENCGNIKFEFGNQTEPWYKSCHDLIMSRFCANDYTNNFIYGIKIRNIIRVTNRSLLAKFEENLINEVDENDYLNNKPSMRKKFEYLMYSWRPKLNEHKDELNSIIKSGFKNPSEYKKAGYEEAIPFSDSMSFSDQNRIEYLSSTKAQQQSTAKVNSSNINTLSNVNKYKFGTILLCKVFTSKFSPYTKIEISPKAYPDYLGVKLPFTSRITSSLETNTDCDCKTKQNEWFLFNKNLAVPEYLIEFEYLNRQNISENAFERELNNLNLNSKLSELKNIVDINNLTNLYSNPEADKNTSKSLNDQNSEAILKKEIDLLVEKSQNTVNLENLTELNLHNCHINSLNADATRNFNALRKLIFSFNKIKSINELSFLTNLEYLDVSFNQIESISCFNHSNKITYFDISNNHLEDSISVFDTLSQFFSMLTNLDISNNLFKRVNKLNLALTIYLSNLINFNGTKLKLTEANINQKLNTKKITKQLIRENCWSISNKPRNLCYLFVTDLINHKNDKIPKCQFPNSEDNDNSDSESINQVDAKNIQDDINTIQDVAPTNHYSIITTLNLDSQNLFTMTNMEFLENLKWASFKNNFISKIEGLEKCTKLEELSFENNFIKSMKGLETLENLRKLNLDNNEIFYTEEPNNNSNSSNKAKYWDFELQRLTHLSISNNRISSMKFIRKMPSLIELYVSFNHLKYMRDIFHLKCLNNLAILDLCYNPMCKENNKYRLFVIYHLKNLKSLDGCSIETNEITESRDLFGGKLTCDFIAEKCNHNKLNEIKFLEFAQCNIRIVDLGQSFNLVSEQFESLRSLNLESNMLTSFSGLVFLKNLKILCLNNNKIESILPKVAGASNKQNAQQHHSQLNLPDKILPNLEVLHLANNGINDLVTLQIGILTSLKVVFLQGNEITRIDGLETLRELRELVLDKNKIKFINEKSFLGQSQRLHELHIEENRLRDLTNIETLKGLQKLYVANNRISEFSEIDRLLDLNHLIEISLINNPISRRPHYRIHMVYRLKKIKILDMTDVIDEDRIKAEIYFNEQLQMQQQPAIYQPIYYNGIVQATQAVPNTNPNINSTINQLEHQLLVLSQSPRLKPIPLVDKPLINGNTQPINIISSNLNSNSKKLKNPLDKLNKDMSTRYRNQFN